ncbi:DNA polymerase alpha subunit B [Trypanosoma conorhini]|uniref:DNA polymerase alpha subunit B n=1 Tax=Trypanosoma conorhini TaxID=83891 RepID=A0A3R7NEZ5_9TRYP|nr:DNA polymerase alpha subunit B [Trypanosoma conorhini]RNF21166.1 DNA polymerase alpha subunit B [Trypanosoma conorhini]
MQQGSRWKSAANLELLLGADHPPARLASDPVSGLANVAGAGVDARNTVGFKNTLYCNRQDAGYASTRQRLVEYYRFMFSKIPLWRKDVQQGEAKAEPTEASLVKQEEDEEDEARESSSFHAGVLPPGYRALGVLTQTNNPGDIGEDLLLPWEFYPVTDINDEEAYVECINALSRETPQLNGFIHVEAEDEDGVTAAGTTTAAANLALGGRTDGRLSLYTRLVPQFTGIYPGMAVGVVGDPFKRSSSGALTGVLVRQLILPARPIFPWSVERPLPTLSTSTPVSTRVHFCSGPFPRRDISSILTAVTNNALSRGADLLIIGGPLVKEFEEFEKELLTLMQRTFDELLGAYLDGVEDVISSYYAANGNRGGRPHLKVVLVSHRDDATQMPALPTTMYGVQDGGDVWVRSNPCRISVNGIHFGVCNEDVVGDMRNKMVERWSSEAGSLRRVVETLVQSRLYAPIYGLPAVKHELKHLQALRLDYVPEASREESHGDDDDDDDAADGRSGRPTSSLAWDSLRSVLSAGKEELEEVKRETKRVKREMRDSSFPLQDRLNGDAAVEWMPHVMFLPSTRPRFAVVTHRGVWDGAKGVVRDESELDNVSAVSGVMVVNQEIWSKRSSPKFELRVAEVTIPDSELVMRRGASEANGVSCGLIHFFNNAVSS